VVGFAFRQQLQGDLTVTVGAGELVERRPFRMAAMAASVERSRSVSSMRNSILPPVWRA
jgi:hypothetical protein